MWQPEPGDLYAAGVVGALIVMFVIVVLGAVLTAINGGFQPGLFFSILLVGAFWGLVFTVPLAFLVIAPLASAIGLLLARSCGPRRWFGAAVGGLTGGIVSGVFIFGFERGDAANPLVLAFLVGVCAAVGLVVQRSVLRWPPPLN